MTQIDSARPQLRLTGTHYPLSGKLRNLLHSSRETTMPIRHCIVHLIEKKPDGTPAKVDARWWGIVVPAAIAFAFLWAVVLLTYLLPPAEVYGNLFRGELTRNQFTFITAATVVLSLKIPPKHDKA